MQQSTLGPASTALGGGGRPGRGAGRGRQHSDCCRTASSSAEGGAGAAGEGAARRPGGAVREGARPGRRWGSTYRRASGEPAVVPNRQPVQHPPPGPDQCPCRVLCTSLTTITNAHLV